MLQQFIFFTSICYFSNDAILAENAHFVQYHIVENHKDNQIFDHLSLCKLLHQSFSLMLISEFF
jgi:hypothetical protein